MRKFADRLLAAIAPKAKAEALCLEVPDEACVNGVIVLVACGHITRTGTPC